MKKMKEIWNRFTARREGAGYTYPVNEEQFEKDPVKPRTSEISQFQDEAGDIETRGPERKIYEEKVYEAAKDALDHPQGTSNHNGDNPNRTHH